MIEVDQTTPAGHIARIVEASRPADSESLVALLNEGLSLYRGRSANEVSRIRGCILASFERVGLPISALPYVLEELESGHSAYLVAAAAIAVRGLDSPTAQVVPYLLRAIENIHLADDSVTFTTRDSAPQTTALEEVFHTLTWLGSHAAGSAPQVEVMLQSPEYQFSTAVKGVAREALTAMAESAHSCCGEDEAPLLVPVEVRREQEDASVAVDVTFEDQDSSVTSYDAFFRGKPSVLAFFYTRCDNPNKCSLTITKLARLQALAAERGLREKIRVAAITYDPAYDLPPRMRAYGQNRGFQFTADDRMLRATGGFDAIRNRFDLGVNFSRTTVNRHRLELHVLDADGVIASSYLRLQWEPTKVLNVAQGLL